MYDYHIVCTLLQEIGEFVQCDRNKSMFVDYPDTNAEQVIKLFFVKPYTINSPISSNNKNQSYPSGMYPKTMVDQSSLIIKCSLPCNYSYYEIWKIEIVLL